MICGIVGCACCAPVGIVGLILGLVSLNEEEGKGFAIAGIVLGALSVAFMFVQCAVISAVTALPTY